MVKASYFFVNKFLKFFLRVGRPCLLTATAAFINKKLKVFGKGFQNVDNTKEAICQFRFGNKKSPDHEV